MALLINLDGNDRFFESNSCQVLLTSFNFPIVNYVGQIRPLSTVTWVDIVRDRQSGRRNNKPDNWMASSKYRKNHHLSSLKLAMTLTRAKITRCLPISTRTRSAGQQKRASFWSRRVFVASKRTGGK